VPPTIGERMNKRWADAIGADPSGYDLTQLLRVPNTINYTDPDAPLVRLIRVTDLRSVPVELDAMLPPLEREHLHDGEHASDNAESENGHGPPVRLGEAYMRLWRGETPVLKDDGSVDRSMTLRAIGLAVARGGGTVPTVAEALRDRDEALGLHKATRRRDGGSGIATRPPAR
jgi:hypothetical protein